MTTFFIPLWWLNMSWICYTSKSNSCLSLQGKDALFKAIWETADQMNNKEECSALFHTLSLTEISVRAQPVVRQPPWDEWCRRFALTQLQLWDLGRFGDAYVTDVLHLNLLSVIQTLPPHILTENIQHWLLFCLIREGEWEEHVISYVT